MNENVERPDLEALYSASRNDATITSIIDYAKKLERDLMASEFPEPVQQNDMDYSDFVVLAKNYRAADGSFHVLYLSKEGEGIDEARRVEHLSEWLELGEHTWKWHPSHPRHADSLMAATEKYAEDGSYLTSVGMAVQLESKRNPAIASLAGGMTLEGQEL